MCGMTGGTGLAEREPAAWHQCAPLLSGTLCTKKGFLQRVLSLMENQLLQEGSCFWQT